MGDENFREVYKQHRTAQDKYTYFLLTAAGAAIAFAMSRTQDAAISWTQAPLAGAVLCWGLSFYFGCRQLAYVESTLYANAGLLRVESGEYPGIGRDPHRVAAAREGVRAAIETNSKRASRFARWQFRFLIIGALFYIAWHIVGMLLRSIP